MKKIKKLYTKILGILISLLFFTLKSHACDFPSGVIGDCSMPEIEKSNIEIIIEFISSNINYFLGLIFLVLTTIFYFLNKKLKNVGKNKD